MDSFGGFLSARRGKREFFPKEFTLFPRLFFSCIFPFSRKFPDFFDCMS